jgi:hypothetical protein
VYRRINGLCFKCGEKFIPGHKCKVVVQPQLNIMVAEGQDGGQILQDEVLELLERVEHRNEEEMTLSLNAMNGTDTSKCTRLRAMVKNHTILQLLDSGSSNTFISEIALAKMGCKVQEIQPLDVKVANGQAIRCEKRALQLEWCCCGKTFCADAYVLPVTAFDMILGMDWLEQHSPMLCAWDKKWVEFEEDGVPVRLQGALDRPEKVIRESSGDQVYKWEKGNEVWAVALIQKVEEGLQPKVEVVPAEVQEVLTQFHDVFKTSDVLPPSRDYDHSITLLPGTTPVNCRPYRYSSLQKDEIERQVMEMLKSGLITRSVSPFAAPVLLVKKKDGSWRFCVD